MLTVPVEVKLWEMFRAASVVTVKSTPAMVRAIIAAEESFLNAI